MPPAHSLPKNRSNARSTSQAGSKKLPIWESPWTREISATRWRPSPWRRQSRLPQRIERPKTRHHRLFRLSRPRPGHGHRPHPSRPALWSHRRGARMDLSPRARRYGDSMTLLVLGATGGTGLEIVRQAIALRHQVTAFVRSPEPSEALQQPGCRQAGRSTPERRVSRSDPAVTMRFYPDSVPGSP